MAGALKGRTALVTGAARGIGARIAARLAAAGAGVVLADIVEEARAAGALEAARAAGVPGRYARVDVSDPDSVEELARQLAGEGLQIHILVNNAGITRDALFTKMTWEQWKQVLAVNLDGAFLLCRAFVPAMVEAGYGRVINVSSVVGQMGNVGQANYAASKAGLIGFTMALARELARKGVTVNAVAPGFTNTEMLATIPPEVMEKVLAQVPMRRLGEPDEIAEAVAYLASDRAAYTTGQVLAVNGGLYM